MNKSIAAGIGMIISLCAVSQNDNNLGNAQGNVFNLNNPATPIQSQVNYNAANNSDQQMPFSNGTKNDMLVSDNNVGVPQQQQASIPNTNANTGNQSKDLSFNLPKLAFAAASSGGSTSSGRKHHSDFSKKMKKLNRKLSYVFAKKGKNSFRVDNCFAWAK